jgi:hypothetical protein
MTRGDHGDVSNQLYACYAIGKDVQVLRLREAGAAAGSGVGPDSRMSPAGHESRRR